MAFLDEIHSFNTVNEWTIAVRNSLNPGNLEILARNVAVARIMALQSRLWLAVDISDAMFQEAGAQYLEFPFTETEFTHFLETVSFDLNDRGRDLLRSIEEDILIKFLYLLFKIYSRYKEFPLDRGISLIARDSVKRNALEERTSFRINRALREITLSELASMSGDAIQSRWNISVQFEAAHHLLVITLKDVILRSSSPLAAQDQKVAPKGTSPKGQASSPLVSKIHNFVQQRLRKIISKILSKRLKQTEIPVELVDYVIGQLKTDTKFIIYFELAYLAAWLVRLTLPLLAWLGVSLYIIAILFVWNITQPLRWIIIIYWRVKGRMSTGLAFSLMATTFSPFFAGTISISLFTLSKIKLAIRDVPQGDVPQSLSCEAKMTKEDTLDRGRGSSPLGLGVWEYGSWELGVIDSKLRPLTSDLNSSSPLAERRIRTSAPEQP
jgi:hypothetical protein